MQRKIPDWIVKSDTILCGYRGSIAHGTHIPSTDPDSIDDIDYMSIFVPGLDHYFGIKQTKETRETFIDEHDLVEYELRKYMGLLLKSNPNVLSLLWLPEKHYIFKNDCGQELIDHRSIFVSKLAFDSFYGYAYSQIKHAGKIGGRGFRGQKRSELVERHGYDTKNAAHCIRLINMGTEFLKDGILRIDRSAIDADLLLAIKTGAWSFDKFVSESTSLLKKMKDTCDTSHLPDKPNYELANKICIKIVSKMTRCFKI